ncbi:MAG: hypothetical protein ABMA26_14530 [Limisphaerales bacterium]
MSTVAEIESAIDHLTLPELVHVQSAVQKRVAEKVQTYPWGEGDKEIPNECALMSERSLARDWDRPEEDAAWANL